MDSRYLVDTFDIFLSKKIEEKIMITYKNDPKYKILITSKNRHLLPTSKNRHLLPIGNVKIRMDKKSTKSHFLRILIKSIQSGVKSVYDRGYRCYLHQFKCHTM